MHEVHIVLLEELVVIGSHFWAVFDTRKPPSFQLASEGREFGLLKEFRQDFGSKHLLVVDDKSLAVWEPSDDIRVRFVGKNVKELWFVKQRLLR